MDVYLVRHGEAAASWGQAADPGLSPLGRAQARAVAGALHACLADGTLLLSSPLARARETAAPLAAALVRDVEVVDAFREVPSPVALADRQAWLRRFMSERWDEQAQALLDWRDSAWNTLLSLQRPTVVFTHFLVINAVVGRILGRAETLCFWPANGSITRLRHCGSSLELVLLGDEMTSVVN